MERPSHAMEKETHEPADPGMGIVRLFDQALRDHLERLIGTGYGIGGLELNVATISSLVFLAEQATKEAKGFSSPSERYTVETLLQELNQLGIDPEQDAAGAIREIIDRGYVTINRDGTLCSQKAAITMAQLLDRVFPGMPGLSLVAYFIQIADEARSGRKDLDLAISHFEQTLRLRSAPLKKERPPAPGIGRSAERGPEPAPSFMAGPRIIGAPTAAPVDPLPRRQMEKSTPRVLSSESVGTGVEIRTVDVADLFHPDTGGLPTAQEPDTPVEPPSVALEEAPETKSEETAQTGGARMLDEVHEEAAPGEELLQSDLGEAAAETELPPEETGEIEPRLSRGPDSPEPPVPLEGVDEAIEKSVAAFEETLAMQCPLCGIGKIETHRTPAAKTYYKCSQKDCLFVSWGKPYHLLCPKCRNPFLVEASDKEGRPILRCPRATCRHWQPHPSQGPALQGGQADPSHPGPLPSDLLGKPRRRIVRRVVRKKR